MTTPFIKSVLLLGLLLAPQLPCFAETSPDYTIKTAHDSVVIPLDGKFKLSDDQKLGGIRVMSFCLPGEDVKDYTRIIGVMSTPVGDSKLSPRELTQKMIDAQKQLKEKL